MNVNGITEDREARMASDTSTNSFTQTRGVSVGDVVLALVALAFGAWAGIVAYLGNGIRDDLRTLNSTIEKTDTRLDTYILNSERRMTFLEAEVAQLRRDFEKENP